METTNIETLLIASASFAAVIVASLFLTGYLVIPAMEWFIIPQDRLENGGDRYETFYTTQSGTLQPRMPTQVLGKTLNSLLRW